MDSNSDFDRRLAEKRATDAKNLAEAKAAAASEGKEPFVLDRFEAVYTRSSPPITTREEQLAEWEMQYYVRYRDVVTITEFARVIEENDVYDGGDW